MNELMHKVKPNAIKLDWPLHNDEACTSNKHHKDQSTLVSALIQPSKLYVHRQVALMDAKIAPNTKIALQNLPKKLDSIISKTSNKTGQMDLIEMHIATGPDATPIATHPYPLALKHHDFLKQEIQNLLDVEIICKSISHWQAQ